jgi:hypothetical protein
MKDLLGDFSAKVGKGDIFNQESGMKIYAKLVIITG